MINKELKLLSQSISNLNDEVLKLKDRQNKNEFDQYEIVLVSHDLVHWIPAFYCFPQDDVHRVAFIKKDYGRVGHLECFKHIMKVK